MSGGKATRPKLPPIRLVPHGVLGGCHHQAACWLQWGGGVEDGWNAKQMHVVVLSAGGRLGGHHLGTASNLEAMASNPTTALKFWDCHDTSAREKRSVDIPCEIPTAESLPSLEATDVSFERPFRCQRARSWKFIACFGRPTRVASNMARLGVRGPFIIIEKAAASARSKSAPAVCREIEQKEQNEQNANRPVDKERNRTQMEKEREIEV